MVDGPEPRRSAPGIAPCPHCGGARADLFVGAVDRVPDRSLYGTARRVGRPADPPYRATVRLCDTCQIAERLGDDPPEARSAAALLVGDWLTTSQPRGGV